MEKRRNEEEKYALEGYLYKVNKNVHSKKYLYKIESHYLKSINKCKN